MTPLPRKFTGAVPPLLLWTFLVAGAIIGFSGCNMHSFRQPGPAPMDSLAVFKAAFDTLKRAGFTLNPHVSEIDLFPRWKFILEYHNSPTAALYITMGDQKEDRSQTNFSNNCWHIDMGSMEDHGSYVRILQNINRISGGDLNFQQMTDYCDEKEDDKAWVSFTLNGDRYKWDLKVHDQWLDGYFFDSLQSLCPKYHKKGRLTFFPEGQAFMLSYLTPQASDSIRHITHLKLVWLDFDSTGQVETPVPTHP